MLLINVLMICHCLYEVHTSFINYPIKVNNFTIDTLNYV